MFAGLVLVAAVAAIAPAVVQPEERAAYDAMLNAQARAAADQFGGSPCPDAKLEPIATQVIRIGDHPDFAAQNERVKIEGCGRTAIENIHVGRFGGSPPWRMVVGLPGESLADTNLQQSAWQQVLTAARAGITPDCRSAALGDVYVAARVGNVDLPPPGTAATAGVRGRFRVNLAPSIEAQRDKLDTSRAWAEVWPLTLCGQDRTSVVVFIPLRGQNASAILPLPIWEQIAQHGAGARPAPAP